MKENELRQILKKHFHSEIDDWKCGLPMMSYWYDYDKALSQIIDLIIKKLGKVAIKKIILKWAKEQEAIDKFGDITLREHEQGDVSEISEAILTQLKTVLKEMI